MYFKLVNKNDVCIQCSRWGIAQLRIFQRLLSLMMTYLTSPKITVKKSEDLEFHQEVPVKNETCTMKVDSPLMELPLGLYLQKWTCLLSQSDCFDVYQILLQLFFQIFFSTLHHFSIRVPSLNNIIFWCLTHNAKPGEVV